MEKKLTRKKKAGGKEKPIKIPADFDDAMQAFIFHADMQSLSTAQQRNRREVCRNATKRQSG